jgi:hypothetical protein
MSSQASIDQLIKLTEERLEQSKKLLQSCIMSTMKRQMSPEENLAILLDSITYSIQQNELILLQLKKISGGDNAKKTGVET